LPATPFSKLASLCRALEATTKRKEKTRLLSEFLRGLKPDEVAPAVLLVVGSVFPEFDPRTLEVGWRTMKGVLEGGRQTTLLSEPLTIGSVHRTLERIAEASGSSSRRVKSGLLEGLISRADPSEVEVLVRIVFGEMRIGVNEGMMLEGIAEAAGVDAGLVRRALMVTGDLGEVARTALEAGEDGLKGIRMMMFVPLKPMLASMSYDIGEVIREHGGVTAFEYKFDGARIQIHREGEQIRVFSRRLTDVTESLPDVVELIRREIASERVILEGEAVAIGEGGRPLPFQDLMRRFTRVHDIRAMAEKIPLRLHIFDVLYLDGRLLIDEPYEERWRLLEEVCPKSLLAERIVTGDEAEAEAFLRRAMEEGHEGLMAKRLDGRYTPGVRGKGWFKIKPAETLDLVVIAAEWGYGRRTGWLSNYHLAARTDDDYAMLGKTFKGLTDDEFRWMTQRLQELKMSETKTTVYVKPEIVVEVAFNELQRSPHYKSGFALRFARIARIREDKRPEDADTLDRVRELYDEQFRHKAKVGL
jgi:DNA ligase-1